MEQTLQERGWTREVPPPPSSIFKGQGLSVCTLALIDFTLYICTMACIFFRSQSIGSANLDQIPSRSPRLSVATTPNYSPSATGYYTYTSATPPLTKGRKVSYAGTEAVVQGSSTLQVGVPALGGGGLPPGSPWKRKLSKTMKHLVVSPRFHRKRYEASEGAATEGSGTSSPQLPKRSWFANFLSEREKSEVVSVFRDKSFSELKASLFRAFDVSGNTSYTLLTLSITCVFHVYV